MVNPTMMNKPQVRLIIAGGRDFTDYELLRDRCDFKLSSVDTTHDITIISGGARGADSLAQQYSTDRNYALEIMEADWDTHGKSAGYKRNQAMSDVATHLIAFWDGESRGTKHMIDIATRAGHVVHVVRY